MIPNTTSSGLSYSLTGVESPFKFELIPEVVYLLGNGKEMCGNERQCKGHAQSVQLNAAVLFLKHADFLLLSLVELVSYQS